MIDNPLRDGDKRAWAIDIDDDDATKVMIDREEKGEEVHSIF